MAGDQEPEMPLLEVDGSVKVPPEQMGGTCGKVGVTLGFTITVIVLTLAHWSALGIKVSVWLPAPAVAGLKELPDTPGPDQEPGMPLGVVFRAVGASVAQKGPMEVSAGVTGGSFTTVTVTVMVY